MNSPYGFKDLRKFSMSLALALGVLLLPVLSMAQVRADIEMVEFPMEQEVLEEEVDVEAFAIEEEAAADDLQSGTQGLTATPLLESTSAIRLDGSWTVRDEFMNVGDFFTGTFTWDSPNPVEFTITDLFSVTDRFEVYDFGTLVNRTPELPDWDDLGLPGPLTSPPYTSNPDVALADGRFSSAVITFPPGRHEITIRDIHIPPSTPGGPPFGDGTVAFRARVAPPPPPPPPPPPTTTVILEQAQTLKGVGDVGQVQTQFMPGEAIRYAALVNNPGSSEVSRRFDFRASGPREIFSWVGDIALSPSRWIRYFTTSVPTDAPVGTYTLRVTMTGNGQTSTKESLFTVAPPAPPLADLSPAGILFNSADLVSGRRVRFDSAVLNSGSQGTGVFNVRWFVDGGSVGSHGHVGLPANSTGASTQFWVAAAGTHTIGLAVDVDNHVAESNESNNARSVTVTVAAPPPPPPTVTLRRAFTKNGVGDVGQEQTQFMPGEVIRYGATANNRGSRAVTRRFDFQASGPRQIFSWTRAVSIPPGRSSLNRPRATRLRIDTPVGTYTLRVTMTGNGQTSTKESLFTVTTARPQGKAPNLIVLVHGCCTNAEHVSEWHTLRNTIINSLKQRYGKKKDWNKDWEIVVWDWSNYTTRTSDNYFLCPICFFNDANTAYDAAYDHDGKQGQSGYLAGAINAYPTYKYIHLLGHSAGAKLIDEAAFQIALNNTDKPFLHITFLDAYTRDDNDKNNYGGLPIDYPHYAEHYVDDGPLDIADATLASAFNFDITNWEDEKDGSEFGHRWPRIWYTRSVESPGRTGELGFKLSLEGRNEAYSTLSQQFPSGGICVLTDVLSTAICGIKLR